jgi:hypothetical protein
LVNFVKKRIQTKAKMTLFSALFVIAIAITCCSSLSLNPGARSSAVWGGTKTPAATSHSLTQTFATTTSSSADATETTDLTRPDYEIEAIALRIGHGFDIHRMAPIEEAGQPIVIGGVTIPHKDQKVRGRV